MSDETKNTTAPEVQSEQVTGPEVKTTPKATSGPKPKAEAKSKTETKTNPKAEIGGALKSVGLDACKRHGIAEVWVTAGGQSFPQSGDAKAHAANLNDKQILNVKVE